jgi:hypothetical protein
VLEITGIKVFLSREIAGAIRERRAKLQALLLWASVNFHTEGLAIFVETKS